MSQSLSNHIARHASNVASTATAGARAASSAVGAPAAPAWAGYWTFTVGSIILFFALYLAQKGRLGVWLQFFSWSNPATNATAAASAPASTNGTGVQGPFPGTTGNGGSIAGQLLNPSTDPVAGPISKALKDLGGGALPGAFFGMGN